MPTTDRKGTHDVVVLAAHRASAAGRGACVDHRDRRALETDFAGHVLGDDAEDAQQRRPCGGVRLRARTARQSQILPVHAHAGDTHALEAVAALDGAGVAVAGGSSKEGKRKGEGGDAGEHLVCFLRRGWGLERGVGECGLRRELESWLRLVEDCCRLEGRRLLFIRRGLGVYVLACVCRLTPSREAAPGPKAGGDSARGVYVLREGRDGAPC